MNANVFAEKDLIEYGKKVSVLQIVETPEFKTFWDEVIKYLDTAQYIEFSRIENAVKATSPTDHAYCNGSIKTITNMRTLPTYLLSQAQAHLEKANGIIKEHEKIKALKDSDKEK